MPALALPSFTAPMAILTSTRHPPLAFQVLGFPLAKERQLAIEEPIAHIQDAPIAHVLREHSQAREMTENVEQRHRREIGCRQGPRPRVAFDERVPDGALVLI